MNFKGLIIIFIIAIFSYLFLMDTVQATYEKDRVIYGEIDDKNVEINEISVDIENRAEPIFINEVIEEIKENEIPEISEELSKNSDEVKTHKELVSMFYSSTYNDIFNTVYGEDIEEGASKKYYNKARILSKLRQRIFYYKKDLALLDEDYKDYIVLYEQIESIEGVYQDLLQYNILDSDEDFFEAYNQAIEDLQFL